MPKVKEYVHKYRKEWEGVQDLKPWISPSRRDATKAFCRFCNKELTPQLPHLKRHAASDSHVRNVRAFASCANLPSLIKDSQEIAAEQQARDSQLYIAGFIAEHNLPMSLADHLVPLIGKVCPDSKIAKNITCARTKVTAVIKDVVGVEEKERVASLMKENGFSLIMDETTDTSTSKCLAVVARVYDDREKMTKDLFLDMVFVADGSAEGLYSSAKQVLVKADVPVKNMIGFAADNASVMMGKKKGVQALFKRDNPSMLVTGCVCHSLHLCASAACLKLPSTVEDLARDVYNYIGGSPKRLVNFETVQCLAQVPVHRLLRPSQTRWLSLDAVVHRVYEQWPALVSYFEVAAADDHLQAARTILNALKEPVYKLYFAFLKYVLPLITKANKVFQSETAQVHAVRSVLLQLYLTIAKNFLRSEQGKSLESLNPADPRNFIPLEEMYCGTEVETVVLGEIVPLDVLTSFRVRVQMFYIELCVQITSRFDFNDATWQLLESLDPKSDAKSVVPLAVRFPNILSREELEDANTEWRQLKNRGIDNLPSPELPVEHYWREVQAWRDVSGRPAFPKLGKLSKSLLALPHSSAAAERVFSAMSLVKTPTRNRLEVDTVAGLLRTKQNVFPSCHEWTPSEKLRKRLK